MAHRLDQRTSAPPPPITLYDLFNRYIAGNPHWRSSQRRNVKARWKKFQAFAGMGRAAHTVTKTMLDEFRAEMAKPGAARSGKAHAVNQIAQHVKFGQGSLPVRTRSRPDPRESPGRIHGQDAEGPGPLQIPEYTPDEARALLGGCDPRDSRMWRLYVALYVFAFAGPRQNAARHLEWADVDFSAGTVRWRPEFDKLGYDRTQLLPAPVIEALRVAYGWRTAYGYEGPYVFFRPGSGTIDRGGWHTARKGPTKRSLQRAAAKPDKPWTYSALNGALQRLEERVAVTHVRHRAAHGFRRYVVTEIHAATGNLGLAGQYVGDKDIRTLARSYLRERPEELRWAVEHMERTEATQKGDAERQPKRNRPAQRLADQELRHDWGT